jgi:hypothetical protein
VKWLKISMSHFLKEKLKRALRKKIFFEEKIIISRFFTLLGVNFLARSRAFLSHSFISLFLGLQKQFDVL